MGSEKSYIHLKKCFPLTNHVNVTLNEITVATKIDQKIPRLRTRNNSKI